MFVEVDHRQEKISKGASEVFQDLHHFTLQMLKLLLLDQENAFQEEVFQENLKSIPSWSPPNIRQEANIKSIEYVII